MMWHRRIGERCERRGREEGCGGDRREDGAHSHARERSCGREAVASSGRLFMPLALTPSVKTANT
jgi:hypothetical protein